MAKRQDPSLEYVAGLCRRNAVHVVKLAWTTHPLVGFDRAGVRWLDFYIEQHRRSLKGEFVEEFLQFMGCFYGECLIAEFGGHWEPLGAELGIRTDGLGVTYPFTAVLRQFEAGALASIAAAFFTAAEYLAEDAA